MPPDPIGVIGLGLVGMALAERLLAAGHAVTGRDPDPARMAMFTALGGVAGDAPTSIVAVYDPAQARAVLPGLRTAVLVTTCAPEDIAALAGLVPRLVECPVSGTSTQIRAGEGLALVAGDTAGLEPVLDVLFPRRVGFARPGDAARAKLGINLILQINRAGLAEGLALAEAMGLDAGDFLAAARASAAASAVMAGKGPKMVARDHAPQSHIAQTLKDADMILEAAQAAGQALPVMTAQRALLAEAVRLAGPMADSSAIIEAVRPR